MSCYVNIFSLGGKPFLELLSLEPIYIIRNPLRVTMKAFIVNSFGKTVRASQLHLTVTVVNGTERNILRITSYDSDTGQLIINSFLPRNMRAEFGNFSAEDRFVEISVTSTGSFTTAISISPVFAGKLIIYFMYV